MLRNLNIFPCKKKKNEVGPVPYTIYIKISSNGFKSENYETLRIKQAKVFMILFLMYDTRNTGSERKK